MRTRQATNMYGSKMTRLIGDASRNAPSRRNPATLPKMKKKASQGGFDTARLIHKHSARYDSGNTPRLSNRRKPRSFIFVLSQLGSSFRDRAADVRLACGVF
jgi:hypothetical protein